MPTDANTINAYNQFAQSWDSNIQDGRAISHKYLEKPAMYSKIPDLNGKTVLCIGCGSGAECEYLKNKGADKVIGIDISEDLIEIAKQNYPKLEFHTMDIEKLDFPDKQFDFIYSSLTLHYLEDWLKALTEVHRVLKPNGTFLFSTHHPVKWGAEKVSETDQYKFITGYSKNKRNKSSKIYGDYLNTRKIRAVWYNKLEVFYYHRPLSAIIKDILGAGLTIVDFLEPKAIDSVKNRDKAFWEIHQKIPLFMIFEVRK